MRRGDPQRTVEEVEDLLLAEADLLRRAQFSGLPGIARRKERLIADGLPDGIGTEAAARLRQLARRNAARMDGAMTGLRAAIARIEALKGQPAELNTYDGTGRRLTLPPDAARPPRRA